MTAPTIIDTGDKRRYGNHLTDPVTLAATGFAAFTNDAGVATDPTEVRLTIQKPDGTQLVYVWPTPGVGEFSLTNDAAGAGRFYADVEHDQAGIWYVRLAGTGAVMAAAETYVIVRESYITA